VGGQGFNRPFFLKLHSSIWRTKKCPCHPYGALVGLGNFKKNSQPSMKIIFKMLILTKKSTKNIYRCKGDEVGA
jgi:hypothetical protein